MTKDMWKDRKNTMTCQTCIWQMPKCTEQGDPIVGRCRRHAPTMNGYPVVYPNDWCGDHKIDENKL